MGNMNSHENWKWHQVLGGRNMFSLDTFVVLSSRTKKSKLLVRWWVATICDKSWFKYKLPFQLKIKLETKFINFQHVLLAHEKTWLTNYQRNYVKWQFWIFIDKVNHMKDTPISIIWDKLCKCLRSVIQYTW